MGKHKSAPIAPADPYILHAGDGVKFVDNYQPDATHLIFDSGTHVYDGLLAAFQVGPVLEDGDVFTNSHHSADFHVSILDYNQDGRLDTMISMGADAFVVLGHTDVLTSDIFGG